MNNNHQMSLSLIGDLLHNMDDSEFLTRYESLENYVGPTVESFHVKNYFSAFTKSFEIEFKTSYSDSHYNIKAPSYCGENGVYPANDEIYYELLAA